MAPATITDELVDRCVQDVARQLRRRTGQPVDICEAEANWQVALALTGFDRSRGIPLDSWLCFAAIRSGTAELLRKKPRTLPLTVEPMMEEPEASEDVWVLLSLVPSGERGALELRFAGDMTYREIGEKMGIGKTSALLRVRRGLERLREMLT